MGGGGGGGDAQQGIRDTFVFAPTEVFAPTNTHTHTHTHTSSDEPPIFTEGGGRGGEGTEFGIGGKKILLPDVVTGPWGGRRWVPPSSRHPRRYKKFWKAYFVTYSQKSSHYSIDLTK